MRDDSIQIAAVNRNKMVIFDDDGNVLWSAPTVGSNTGWRSDRLTTGDIQGHGQQDWAFFDGSGAIVIATPNGKKPSEIPSSQNVSGFAIASPPARPGCLIALDGDRIAAYTFHQ